MQERIISTDFLGFLRFGVQQKLAMNKEKWMMCYRQDADSTNNILHYKATTTHNEVFFGFQH